MEEKLQFWSVIKGNFPFQWPKFREEMKTRFSGMPRHFAFGCSLVLVWYSWGWHKKDYIVTFFKTLLWYKSGIWIWFILREHKRQTSFCLKLVTTFNPICLKWLPIRQPPCRFSLFEAWFCSESEDVKASRINPIPVGFLWFRAKTMPQIKGKWQAGINLIPTRPE